MPKNTPDVLECIKYYASGYFPMYDVDDAQNPQFYWDRWPVRGIIPLNADTLARARRLGKRAQKLPFEIRYTTAVEEVIAQLGTVKEHSWVKAQVVEIYRALHAAHLLHTVETWSNGRLVGALLGIILPGIYVAETMYGLVPEASKICLCQLVQDCAAKGFTFIDVQTPHDSQDRPRTTAHPCIRLGEIVISLEEFLEIVHTTWTREFDGDAADWVDMAEKRTVRVTRRDDPRRFLSATI